MINIFHFEEFLHIRDNAWNKKYKFNINLGNKIYIILSESCWFMVGILLNKSSTVSYEKNLTKKTNVH